MAQLVNLDSVSAKTMLLVMVHNARTSHMFMYNKRTRGLHVYNIDSLREAQDGGVFTFYQLQRERLVTIVPQFDYCPYATYYLDGETIRYVAKSHLIARNIVTGQRQEIKLQQKLCRSQYAICPRGESLQIYFRSLDGNLYFTDLMWMNDKALYDHCQRKLVYKIYDSQSVIHTRLVLDGINDQLACFVSPSVVSIIPNLSWYSTDAEGTFDSQKRYIATTINRNPLGNPREATKPENNVPRALQVQQYQCPSEFVANLCALDIKTNTIKVWNVGTGHFISEKVLTGIDFEGFEFHNQLKDSTLVVWTPSAKPSKKKAAHVLNESHFNSSFMSLSSKRPANQALDQIDEDQKRKFNVFRKIRVLPQGVVVLKQFYYTLREGSQIFVNSDNDILLDFSRHKIEIRAIRNDGLTDYIDDIQRPAHLDVPAYFSEDFKKVIKFEYSKADHLRKAGKGTELKQEENKMEFHLYECKVKADTVRNQNRYEKFKRRQDLTLPDYDHVQRNKFNLPYISLVGDDKLTFLSIHDIEQTVSLAYCSKDKLLENKDKIREHFLNHKAVVVRRALDPLDFKDGFFGQLSNSEAFNIKQKSVKAFNIELKYLNSIQDEKDLLLPDALAVATERNLVGISNAVDTVSYTVNSLRFLKSYSFHTWKLIEMIAKDEVQIADINTEKLKELMLVILPHGQSLVSELVNNVNMAQLY